MTSPTYTIRQHLQQQRAAISPAERRQAEEQVCQALIERTRSRGYTRVAVYQAIKKELSLKSYINWLHQQHATICLPVIDQPVSGAMQFHSLGDEQHNLVGGRFGLLEPRVSQASLMEPHQLDLVCVPMLGFHKTTRMGWGKGYYDRCFAFRKTTNLPPLLVGIAFSVQHHQDIHPQPWDVDMDEIICGEIPATSL